MPTRRSVCDCDDRNVMPRGCEVPRHCAAIFSVETYLRKPGKYPLSANPLRSCSLPGFSRIRAVFSWSFLCSFADTDTEPREKSQQRKDSMPQPICPRCSSDCVKRVSRVGTERLLSFFYIYPFRCQPCGHRFKLLQWGVTYTRIDLDRRVGWKRH